MTEKCEYFLEIKGRRIKSKAYIIEERDNGYTFLWDEKYGESLTENKDIIKDTEWKRMKQGLE